MRIKLIFIFVLINVYLVSAQSLFPTSNGEVIEHNYYTLSYIEAHEQSEWVAYWLLKDYVNGATSRTDDFREDMAVKTGSANLSDYKSSGYDRGHLCPAADMKQTTESMSETFYMSNMSPQTPSFNRGAWKKLEEQVRKWTLVYDSLYVVTGPVFLSNIGTIGYNKVTIPGYYYKVLYSPQKELMQAFILPNRGGLDSDWGRYSISVDSLEILTGIDFFYEENNNEMMETLEKDNNYSAWISVFGTGYSISTMETTKTSVPQIIKNSNKVNNKVRQQCKGIAKSTGKRCKIMTSNPNGYCHHHQSQSGK